MPFGGRDSERALILLKRRDAEVASKLLIEASFAVQTCADSTRLLAEIEMGAGFAVVSEELAVQGVEGVDEWMK